MWWSRILAPCPCIHYDTKGITDSRLLFCCVVSCEVYYWAILVAISSFLFKCRRGPTETDKSFRRVGCNAYLLYSAVQARLHGCYREAVWHPQRPWSLRFPRSTLWQIHPILRKEIQSWLRIKVTPSVIRLLSQNLPRHTGSCTYNCTLLSHHNEIWERTVDLSLSVHT